MCTYCPCLMWHHLCNDMHHTIHNIIQHCGVAPFTPWILQELSPSLKWAHPCKMYPTWVSLTLQGWTNMVDWCWLKYILYLVLSDLLAFMCVAWGPTPVVCGNINIDEIWVACLVHIHQCFMEVSWIRRGPCHMGLLMWCATCYNSTLIEVCKMPRHVMKNHTTCAFCMALLHVLHSNQKAFKNLCGPLYFVIHNIMKSTSLEINFGRSQSKFI